MMEGKAKTKKAKVQREGKKFDSANHEIEKQTGQKTDAPPSGAPEKAE